MIVEDEARIRSFLARAFEAEGFTVDVVSNGERGLVLGTSGGYEIVILDLLLPGRDGLDVLGELHHRRPGLPVVVLSARSDLATKLRSFELGAVDFLAKPFALDELLARARVALRRASIVEDGTSPARRQAGARCGAPPGSDRRHCGRPVGPRVSPAPFPDAPHW